METFNWKPEFYFLQELNSDYKRVCYARKGYLIWGNQYTAGERLAMPVSKVSKNPVDALISFAVCEDRSEYSLKELFLLDQYLSAKNIQYPAELAFYFTSGQNIKDFLDPYRNMPFPLIALISEGIIKRDQLSSEKWLRISEEDWALFWYNRENNEFCNKFIARL